VGAGLHDPPVLEDQDPVGREHRGQSMGDHEAGAAMEQRLQGGLDELLGDGVEVAGGLVEDQDAGVFEDHPGDRDSLLFTAGQPVAAFADHGVVSVGQGADELV